MRRAMLTIASTVASVAIVACASPEEQASLKAPNAVPPIGSGAEADIWATTIDELVYDHDMIIVGTVGQYIRPVQDPSDEEFQELGWPTEVWEGAIWMYHEFEVDVEQVFVDRLGFLETGTPLTVLNPLGPPYPEGEDESDGYVRTGDHHLMLLSQVGHGWPQHVYQPTTNAVTNRIDIDGPTPVDAMGRPVPSARDMTTEEFLVALEKAIAESYPSATP